MAKQTEPRKVTKVPEGYKEEVRGGKTVFVKKTDRVRPAQPSDTPPRQPKAPSIKKASGTTKPNNPTPPTHTPRVPEVSFDEDVVYLDEPTPVVEPVQKQQSLRTDTKEVFTGGLPKGVHQYQVPDLNTGGNYTKQKNVFTDEEGNPVQFNFKENKYIKTGEPNFRTTMPVQNDTPTIQNPLKPNELPTKFDVVPERLRTQQYNAAKIVAPKVDSTQYKGFNELDKDVPLVPDAEFQKQQEKNLAIPKLNKGGLVGKIKGMYAGGNVPYNPYQVNNTEIQPTENPVSGQGIIQMAGATQFTPTGNAVNSQGTTSVVANNTANVQGNSGVKAPRTEQQIKNDANARAGANAAGAALGAYGSSYYASQTPTSDADATRNAGMSAVSKAGGIGGMISGVSAWADEKGKDKKKTYQAMDSEGNLKNENMSRRNAIGGGLLSPTKALAYRSESGNWGDIDGRQYNDFIEKKAKDQLAKVNEANIVDKQKQAVTARDAGNFDPTVTTLYDTRGASFDTNSQQLILADGQQFDPNKKMANGGLVGKIKRSLQDGGVIKGKGTGKSDSINAKVEADSFVVPAENADVAEELRAKLLKSPPKTKANLKQSGGEPVKLSNGEHLFTPEEKQELLNKGVNVDLLAPKSEEKAVKKEMMSFPNVTGYRNGGKVGEKVGNATWDGKKWVGADGSVYSNSYIERMDKEASIAKVKETEYRVHQLSKHYDKIKDAPDRKDESLRVKAEIDALSGKAVSNKEIAKVASGVKAPSVRAPKVSKEAFAPIQSIDATGSALTQDAEIRNVELAKKQEASIEAASGKQQVAYDNGVKTNAEYVKANSPKTNSKFGALAGRIDPTMLAGIGQTALGLKMLKNEVRPLDQTKLDSAYNENVNRAQADAQFGFNPEQAFTLEQARQNAENDSRFSARNFAGGNAGAAFNQERQAINQGWMNKLGLANENQQIRMDKQRYADQEVQQRADIKQGLSRTAFKDAMYTFQQKQEAGSELIGAGINNTIGAIRYQQELDAMEKADKQRNGWLGTV